MKNICLLFAFSASLAAFGLTDIYWVGGTSGDWTTASNWSGGIVPNDTIYHVHITNKTAVTIALTGNKKYYVGGISFSGANHAITAPGTENLAFGAEAAGAAAPVIYVESEFTATIPSAQSKQDEECSLVKTGGGTLEATGLFGSGDTFSSLEIVAGIFRYNGTKGTNKFRVGGLCTVRSGATFMSMENNLIHDSQVFFLEENAIFDNNGKYDTVGGFTGQGIVTNLNNSYDLVLCGGPVDFAGRVFGRIALAPSTNYVDGGEGYLRVCASNTLANAAVKLAGDAVYTNVLRFAPGVGAFEVKSIDFGTRSDPVLLEDTDGDPITLTASFANYYQKAAFAGCGNFVKSNDNTWIITNDIYSATGMLVAKAGTIQAGTSTEGFDATSLANISRLDVGSWFDMFNYAETTWNTTITGAGGLSYYGPGSWTLNNLSLTNGSITVWSPKTGNVATNIVFAGGTSTNLYYKVNPSTFKTTITGGEYVFSNYVSVSGNRTFEQTGGSVRCALYASGSNCSNDICYVISGGRLVSYFSSAVGQYPGGIGLDISGDAHVELLGSDSGYAHRVASGTVSHTIRLSDNAYLVSDDLRIVGEQSSTNSTGVIELDGGVMEAVAFSKPIGSGTVVPASAEGKIVFNGGVLRLGGTGDKSWWDSAWDPYDRVKGHIASGGAFIDVKSDGYDRLLTINWPFVTGVESGTDGGFVKLGRGRLQLSRPYAGSGVFEVREGRFEMNSGMGATPFGTAEARIGMGEMRFPSAGSYSLAATSGASLSYTGCATLRLSSGVALTIGPSGAAADSAVARCGHGVLTVMSGSSEEALGVNASVTVNGGLSNDATTGILSQPIFERRAKSSYNAYRARFLKCDANNKLVPATPVEFDPTTSIASTVAQITGSMITVSDNASVGALVVERSSNVGMTVNDGVTLSVGPNTAGSIAPILLNNVSLSGGSNAKTGIAGSGTIDFGASEGVIVVNGNATLSYPVNIETAIAGSGGVTFAAPTLFSDGIRGYVVLNKAGTYTGGTWIENVHVATTAANGFGTGMIHVSGSELEGGALEIAAKYNSNTFANQIEIAGNGPVYSASVIQPGYYGALIVSKGGVTLSGGLTLAADAKIASGARGGQKAVVFSAPIVGPGKLTVSGTSPFRFAAANTYAGGTVITNGTVEVAELGTLGSGPVKICAGGVLRFVNTSAKTIDNVITGDGRIEMNGAVVTLTSAEGFLGDIAGNVSGVGDSGYVKSGEGTVTFTNALSYTGATTVSAGTLRLGPAPLGVPAASESIAFHLDASAGNTITEESSAVVAWSDADGRNIAFTNVVANGPSRATGALNAKDALYFNGESGRRLVANAATPEFRTVFLVNCVTNDTRPSGTTWAEMGMFGMAGKDNGLRFKDRTPGRTFTEIKADSMFLNGILHIDGESSMSVATAYDYMRVPDDKFVVTEAEVATPVQNATFAIGDYLGGRSYFGDIAEVIAYDRWLTEDERIATERYLQNKWGLKEVVANGVFTNVLPVATALTVADGATVDLAGGFQEVASLSGAGTIANSSPLQATLVLSSGMSRFSGSFSGDFYLEVAAGATLDLGGGTITVSGIGGSGRICNGTVVVTGEIQPGGRGAVGTLTFEMAPVVVGATLFVDVDKTAVDALVVEDAFDMTGLLLSVPHIWATPCGNHEIVSADDSLSGGFAATDLPANDLFNISYTANAAVLSRYRSGFFIVVR